MEDYKLTPAERETVITFTDADKEASVFSTSETWMKKIKKLPGAKQVGDGYEAIVPKGWIAINQK